MRTPDHPYRLLMTTDTVGGVWTFALELCRGLGSENVEVVLATMGAPLRPDQAREVATLSHVDVCESGFALEWMPEPWEDVDRAGRWLLELERISAADLVHLNGYAHASLPWRSPVLVTAHSCVVSWWASVKKEAAPPDWEEYRRRVGQGIQSANSVVAPTRWMLEQLEQNYGPVPGGHVIANGVGAADFRPHPKESFVLCVGRLWDEAKNARALARIAPQLTWPVWMAGDAPASAANGDPLLNVRHFGRCDRSDLAKLYGAAAIFALPARYEPFGLSVLEAALSGCALVLGDIPTLRDLWADAALFVSPDDDSRLANTIEGLIADPARRAELGAAAQQRARGFSRRAMTEGYLGTYRALLEERVARDGSTPDMPELIGDKKFA